MILGLRVNLGRVHEQQDAHSRCWLQTVAMATVVAKEISYVAKPV